MGNLIITDANGKVVEETYIESAHAAGERKTDASSMKEGGNVQWHRSFQRERVDNDKGHLDSER